MDDLVKQARLTDSEIPTPWHMSIDIKDARRIADAQLKKALQAVVDWLREESLEAQRTGIWPNVGYLGLKIAGDLRVGWPQRKENNG